MVSALRDPFSAVSHYIAAAIGLAAVSMLVSNCHTTTGVVSFVIFGFTMVGLYLSSAIYHTPKTNPPWQQKLEHATISWLIAGSYVPICLLALPRQVGIPVLGIETSLAIVGLIANIWFEGGPKWLRLTLYLVMGWISLAIIGPLQAGLGIVAFGWLLAGGFVYSIGTIIYASKRPRLWPGRFGSHDLWHLFVMAGTACHLVTMFSLRG
jgi:hemolysin III